MKFTILLIALLATTTMSFAQFTDSAQLGNYVRDTIKDRRPNKVTAAELQKAFLGAKSLLIPKTSISQIVRDSMNARTLKLTYGGLLGNSIVSRSGDTMKYKNIVAGYGIDSTVTDSTVTYFVNTKKISLVDTVQIFTSNGTWTKPIGAKSVTVTIVAPGGGGGSGRLSNIISNPASGGAGGSGGGTSVLTFLASNLDSVVSVFVGNGGAGGAAVTTTSTNGNNGSNGDTASFGIYLKAFGGLGGGGGGTSVGSPGGGGGASAFTVGISGAGGNGGSGYIIITTHF